MSNNATDIQTVNDKDDDRVTIFIPRIEGEDPEVTVGINGVFTKIQKGKTVRVPRNVAAVIEQSNEMAMEAWENRQKFKYQRTDL